MQTIVGLQLGWTSVFYPKLGFFLPKKEIQNAKPKEMQPRFEVPILFAEPIPLSSTMKLMPACLVSVGS